MAGRGRPPKPPEGRVNDHEPIRGEWQAAPGVGWQHGDIPPAPTGLLKASREAWAVWMRSWFAAHWTPDDLPGMRQVIRVYDQVERGDFTRANEMRLQMDTYGITPKGQQDRRWTPPVVDANAAKEPTPTPGGRYAHLRAVPDAAAG